MCLLIASLPDRHGSTTLPAAMGREGRNELGEAESSLTELKGLVLGIRLDASLCAFHQLLAGNESISPIIELHLAGFMDSCGVITHV